MKNELKTNLQALSKADLHLILWNVRLRWLRHKVSLLHPVQLLIPITSLQIIVFVFAAINPEKTIPIIAIGNLVIVSLAIFPSTLQHPKPSAHWVS